MPRRGPLIGGDNTIQDPNYVFADDPVADANARLDASRARQDQLQAGAQDAQERERDRQFQAGLLAQQQQFAGQRDAFDAQQTNQRQGLSLATAYQQHLDSLGAQAQERQQTAGEHKDRYLLDLARESAGWDERQQSRADAADKFQTQRQDEWGQLQARQDYDAQKAVFDAQERERSQRFQADEQSQHIVEHAQAQTWANQQQLTQSENMRLQRLQNGRAKVEEDVAAGKLSQEEGDAMLEEMATQINPLHNRLIQSQIGAQKAAEMQRQQAAAHEAAMNDQNMRFRAQSFGEHVGTYQDENGKVWRGFQTKEGHWEVHNPYEQEQKEREHALKIQQQADTTNERLKAQHESRLNSAVKQTTSQWQSDYTNTSRQVDKEIQDAQRQAEKKSYDDDPEKKAAEQRWVAKLKDNRDSMIHDRMKQTKRWKDVGADKDALDAALEADKQSKMESWQPPLQSRGTQQPQAPLTPAERIQQQHERDRIPGGAQQYSPGHGWNRVGADLSQPPVADAPQAKAPPQATAGGAMQQIDQMIDEARGGNQAVYAAATRIKAALSKYRTIDQMPPAEREQYLRDKRIAGLGQ